MKWKRKPLESELTWVLMLNGCNPPKYRLQCGFETENINHAKRYTKIGARLLAGRLGGHNPVELQNSTADSSAVK